MNESVLGITSHFHLYLSFRDDVDINRIMIPTNKQIHSLFELFSVDHAHQSPHIVSHSMILRQRRLQAVVVELLLIHLNQLRIGDNAIPCLPVQSLLRLLQHFVVVQILHRRVVSDVENHSRRIELRVREPVSLLLLLREHLLQHHQKVRKRLRRGGGAWNRGQQRLLQRLQRVQELLARLLQLSLQRGGARSKIVNEERRLLGGILHQLGSRGLFERVGLISYDRWSDSRGVELFGAAVSEEVSSLLDVMAIGVEERVNGSVVGVQDAFLLLEEGVVGMHEVEGEGERGV